MDELPREAREVLALAEDAHDPPDRAAMERVRHGLAMAIAASAGVGVAGTSAASAGGAGSVTVKASLFSSAAKLWLVGGAIVVAGATTVGVAKFLPRPTPTAQTPSADTPQTPIVRDAMPPAPRPAATPIAAVAEPTAEETAPPAPATRRPRERTARRPAVAAPSLQVELAILHAASAALDQRDLAEAEVQLARHRALFPRGQLREEREGFSVLVLCLAGNPQSVTRARAFLTESPDGVLAARVEAACASREER